MRPSPHGDRLAGSFDSGGCPPGGGSVRTADLRARLRRTDVPRVSDMDLTHRRWSMRRPAPCRRPDVCLWPPASFSHRVAEPSAALVVPSPGPGSAGVADPQRRDAQPQTGRWRLRPAGAGPDRPPTEWHGCSWSNAAGGSRSTAEARSSQQALPGHPRTGELRRWRARAARSGLLTLLRKRPPTSGCPTRMRQEPSRCRGSPRPRPAASTVRPSTGGQGPARAAPDLHQPQRRDADVRARSRAVHLDR